MSNKTLHPASYESTLNDNFFKEIGTCGHVGCTIYHRIYSFLISWNFMKDESPCRGNTYGKWFYLLKSGKRPFKKKIFPNSQSFFYIYSKFYTKQNIQVESFPWIFYFPSTNVLSVYHSPFKLECALKRTRGQAFVLFCFKLKFLFITQDLSEMTALIYIDRVPLK